MRLRIVENFVALTANWNYIKPVFFIVSVMMMVFLCLFNLANRAYLRRCSWKPLCFYCIRQNLVRLIFFRKQASVPFRSLRNFFPVLFAVIILFYFSCRNAGRSLAIFSIIFCVFLTMRLIIFFGFFQSACTMREMPFPHFYQIFCSIISVMNFCAFLTPNSPTVFPAFVARKLINRFYLSTFTASLFHSILQTKMPIASWSSMKQQARLILTQNVFARPNAFDFFDYITVGKL